MQRFQAVIIGGDLGAYALARQLHDAYGVIAHLVTAYDPLPIRDSAIVHRHAVARADEAGPLVDALVALGQQLRSRDPDLPVLLLANTDWRIHVMARHRSRLEQVYTMALPPLATIERVSDKIEFEALARAQGISVPRSSFQDFSGAGEPGWRPGPLDEGLRLPVIAKPADSSRYETLVFEGRKKVYLIESEAELAALWRTLADAGFRDRFVVQELIPGDDTSMYSVTAYVDRSGEVTMAVAAHVLLEEHAPATLGNPCAMVTIDAPELLDQAERFLRAVDYHGFANFDIKADGRTGEMHFLEVNPRIGRNSFYCVGAGINPMEVLVDDVLGDIRRAPVRAGAPSLYCLVPHRLLRRYLVDDALRRRVESLVRARRVINPLRNPADASLKRRLYRLAGELSHVRKFRRYYPRPTSTGF